MKMQQKKQAGFTLIELMIVVTIIGILASIAVPAYRDYTIRTRVGECASVFSPMKTEYSVYYSENGDVPATIALLAANGRVTSSADQYAGDYVSGLTLAASTAAVCTLSSDPTRGLGTAAGENVRFSAETTINTVNWLVNGTVETKFLPATN